MNKKCFFCFIILLMLFISGCTEKNEGSDETVNKYIGYVVNKEDKRILVTNYKEEPEIHDAIWVITSQDIEIGNKVSIKFDGGLETSKPAKGLAEDIEVLESEHPESSTITEREAIYECLNSLKGMSVPIIKSVSYSEENKLWTIIVIDDKAETKEGIVIEIKG